VFRTLHRAVIHACILHLLLHTFFPHLTLPPPLLQVTAYAIETAQDRGQLFVRPGDQVYEGQVVGVYNKSGDLKINVCKAKALTNMRASQSEKKVSAGDGFYPHIQSNNV